jgi:hypothetical protein
VAQGALFPLAKDQNAPAGLPAGFKHHAAKRYRFSGHQNKDHPTGGHPSDGRRQHAATGPLPPNLAANFTTGELAALKIVADEFLAHGACDLSRNEIGARAGVSKTVVKHALKLAERNHSMIKVERRPRSGRKHLTNIIRIVRAEWLDWLRKGHRKAYAIAACARAKPDFHLARGAQKNPPRAQVLRNSGGDRVDKTVKKRNRAGASPTRL